MLIQIWKSNSRRVRPMDWKQVGIEHALEAIMVWMRKITSVCTCHICL